MKKILTKKTLTIAFVFSVAGVFILNFLGFLFFSPIGPEEVRGLKIKGSVLYADLNNYELINIIVDTSNNPDILKVYGVNGSTSTEITSHFEPTTTYSGLTFNLTPLKTTGKGGVMPAPVGEYYLIPVVGYWGLLRTRFLEIHVSNNQSTPGSIKLFNPSPPYQPGR